MPINSKAQRFRWQLLDSRFARASARFVYSCGFRTSSYRTSHKTILNCFVRQSVAIVKFRNCSTDSSSPCALLHSGSRKENKASVPLLMLPCLIANSRTYYTQITILESNQNFLWLNLLEVQSYFLIISSNYLLINYHPRHHLFLTYFLYQYQAYQLHHQKLVQKHLLALPEM